MPAPLPATALHPVAHAIAKNDEAMLRSALADHPQWRDECTHGDVQKGTSCWTQVVISKDRTHLWPLLTEYGLTHATPLLYKGTTRSVLSMAVEFGRLKLVSRLLDAGADPNVWVKRRDRSAIEALTRRWRQVTDEVETYPILELIERFSTQGVEVSPILLSLWMTYAGYRHGKHANQAKRLRALAQSAWDKGVRPMCEQEKDSPLSPLQAGLLLMLHVGDEGARAWLTELLTSNPPTPLWARVALDEISRNHYACENFPALLAVVKAAWPTQAMTWSPETIGGWKSRFEPRGSSQHQVLACARFHLELLKWGMDNGLPVEHLVQTPRALLPGLLTLKVLAACGTPLFPMEVLAFGFSHQQWLSTSMAGQHSFEKYLVNLASASVTGAWSGDPVFAKEFWQRHGQDCRVLESNVRATSLKDVWDEQVMMKKPAAVRF